jgi:hypothetical protein
MIILGLAIPRTSCFQRISLLCTLSHTSVNSFDSIFDSASSRPKNSIMVPRGMMLVFVKQHPTCRYLGSYPCGQSVKWLSSGT